MNESLDLAILAPVQSIYVRAGLQERSDNFRDWVYPSSEHQCGHASLVPSVHVNASCHERADQLRVMIECGGD